MGLISGMNEEERARYGKLVEAFGEAKKTGERQQFPCVGLKGVTLEIDDKRNVYKENGEFVMTYNAEVFKKIPKEEENN